MDTGKDMKTTLHHRSKERNCLTNKMAYLSPDYPLMENVDNFQRYTYNGYNQQMSSQPMYYGGNGCWGNGYSCDPESRRVAQQQPFVQQPMFSQPQFAQQPQYSQPLQPFSAYGGSGAQVSTSLPAMPTLDSRRVPTTAPAPAFTQPLLQQTQFVPNPMPNMIRDDRMYPLFSNPTIQAFDRNQQLWDNAYVSPREMPMPNIAWNKPVPQPQYVPQYQPSPFVQQPNMQMTWTEVYNKNKMAQI